MENSEMKPAAVSLATLLALAVQGSGAVDRGGEMHNTKRCSIQIIGG